MGWLAAYLALGTFTGFLAGLFGIGGGLLFVPLLSWLFAAQGLAEPLHLALGTSMATILFTASSSARTHHQHGAVNFSVVRGVTPGLLLGTVLGTWLAGRLPAHYLSGFFALFMCYVALQMALEFKPSATRTLPGHSALIAVGSGIGAISSLVSIGGGTLSVPFMLYHNVPLRQAIGTSAALGVPIAIGGSAGYILLGLPHTGLPAHTLGYLYLPALGMLLLGSIVTAPLGAKAAHRLPVKPLRRAFAGLLVLLAGKMLWQAVA